MARLDHKFSMCARFGDAYEALSCEAAKLQPIVQAFKRNMNRVRGIGMLPLNLTLTATINEAARVEALVNKKVPLHDPRITYNDPHFDEALFSEVDAERKRLIDEWMKSWGDNFDARAAIVGGYGMDVIIDANKEQAWDAVQATMAAMLIGLWTAFESLAQDTWISAVNTHPIPLAERVVEPKANLETGMQLKSLSMREIVRAGFNLTGSMGDLLLRQHAVDFQSLKTIRAAYKTAFAAELESIFESHEVELSRLEAVRNLFVHKGGLVDLKFTERMGNEPDMKDKIGHSLSVNGEYVTHKANVVSVCSTQLIQAVDKWISQNPETR